MRDVGNVTRDTEQLLEFGVRSKEEMGMFVLVVPVTCLVVFLCAWADVLFRVSAANCDAVLRCLHNALFGRFLCLILFWPLENVAFRSFRAFWHSHCVLCSQVR